MLPAGAKGKGAGLSVIRVRSAAILGVTGLDGSRSSSDPGYGKAVPVTGPGAQRSHDRVDGVVPPPA